MKNSKDAKGPWEWFWLFKRYLLWAIKDVIEAAACEINVDLGMDGSVECPPSPTSHHQSHNPPSPLHELRPLCSALQNISILCKSNHHCYSLSSLRTSVRYANISKKCPKENIRVHKKIQCMTFLCSLLFKGTRIVQWIWWPTWIWKAIDHL